MEEIYGRLSEAISIFLMDVDLRSVNWQYRAGPGKWSKKEILGHLIDSASINLQRFIRCTVEDNFSLSYNAGDWVAAQRYEEIGLNHLLALWELLNFQIIQVLRHFPPDRYEALCVADGGDPKGYNIEFLADDYVTHLQHHLDQIKSKS